MTTDTMARVNKVTIERVRKAFPTLTFDAAVMNMVENQELANIVIQNMGPQVSVIHTDIKRELDEFKAQMAEFKKKFVEV